MKGDRCSVPVFFLPPGRCIDRVTPLFPYVTLKRKGQTPLPPFLGDEGQDPLPFCLLPETPGTSFSVTRLDLAPFLFFLPSALFFVGGTR